MSTAPTASPAPLPSKAPSTFTLDKTTSGGVTLVTLRGTVDHEFLGKKIADALPTKKIILDLREVRRFSSWGMSEWMEFLRVAQQRDLYIVECSSYAASQLNLVTGLLGHAKLVGFYASARCSNCTEEIQSLFLLPRDSNMLRDYHGDAVCATCGGRVRMEDHASAFFKTVGQRSQFDIDDEVLAFLRTRYQYDLPIDLTRFRAYRRGRDNYSYLRLSGSIGRVPAETLVKACHGTTVVDVEGTVFETGTTGEWRHFLEKAAVANKPLQLLGCPPGFLEATLYPEDFSDKLKVRSFALSYDCARCEKTTVQMIDVAATLEHLVAGAPPHARCESCQFPLSPAMTPEQLMLLRALPARDRDPALDKFLAKAKAEPNDKLEDVLAKSSATAVEAPARSSRMLYAILGISVLVIAGLVLVLLNLSNKEKQQVAIANVPQNPTPNPGPNPTPPTPPQPQFVRPDWIIADVPSSGYCQDMINRLMCIGVSPYRSTRDEAIGDANDAALEELANEVGLKISDPYFRDSIVPGYAGPRATALGSLQASDLDRAGSGYAAADDVVLKARRRAVEALQLSGGAAVPSRRTDWYWEEYAKQGGGTETLVFVRYDVPMTAVRALVDKYGTPSQALHSTVMNAFPEIAWQEPEFAGGVLVKKPDHTLASAGIKPNDLILFAGDERIADATAFAHILDEWKPAAGPLKLKVKTPGSAIHEVELKKK